MIHGTGCNLENDFTTLETAELGKGSFHNCEYLWHVYIRSSVTIMDMSTYRRKIKSLKNQWREKDIIRQ